MEEANPSRTTLVALAFEGGLGALALAIGWLVGHQPAVGISLASDAAGGQFAAIGWGLLATVPLLMMLMALDRFPFGPLVRVREIAHDLVGQLFRGASVLQLVIVAVAAGAGEELLFRGLAQDGLSRLVGGEYGNWVALAVASLLFGVCHWLNTTYAFLALLAGLYFGLLLMLTGSLWTPVVAHAAYDFIALVYLVRPKNLIRLTIEPLPSTETTNDQ